ncbi:hypothetical protein RSPO_m01296 (plasmid) [Ralstonia solanacearum Po82]|uniref:Uncharacterized protein n=1 Tax=Ralstonia solanacearum (strain Po82) TaxID=1031711 RepID=F6G9L7_RALS8|nr:hypothetical protein RSPO_m01296 [Ralstonia solanacearum Po82]
MDGMSSSRSSRLGARLAAAPPGRPPPETGLPSRQPRLKPQ